MGEKMMIICLVVIMRTKNADPFKGNDGISCPVCMIQLMGDALWHRLHDMNGRLVNMVGTNNTIK